MIHLYQVSGYTFLESSDPDDVLLKAFRETRARTINEMAGDEVVDLDYSSDEFDQEAQTVLESARDTLVYYINKYTIKDYAKSHEDHWIEFLSSFGFEASILDYNSIPMLSMIKGLDISASSRLMWILTNLNDRKYLKISRMSRVRNSEGANLILSDHFIYTIKSSLPAVSVEKDSVMIQYAPSKDIILPITITRYLHLLL